MVTDGNRESFDRATVLLYLRYIFWLSIELKLDFHPVGHLGAKLTQDRASWCSNSEARPMRRY